MSQKPLIVDAHEDMAWNMISMNRDYTHSVAETRRSEVGTDNVRRNGDTLLGWDTYQQGRVVVVFSTLFAAPARTAEEYQDIQDYHDTDEAHQVYRNQVERYKKLAGDHPDKFTILTSKPELEAHLQRWRSDDEAEPPVGLVILMESADAVRQPAEVELWWELGVRIIGPAWVSTRYCGGTGEPGPLTKDGFALLEAMAAAGFVLDISHMDEAAVLQSLDTYTGRIIASHANAKALLPGTESNRFLSDRVIEGLIEREGVIGVVPYNRFLNVEWKDGDPREMVTLEHITAQIDYFCQKAGNAQHVGFGSDADGGFGLQSSPTGMDSIADLQKLVPLLENKGYSPADISAIFGGNWLKMLSETLPE